MVNNERNNGFSSECEQRAIGGWQMSMAIAIAPYLLAIGLTLVVLTIIVATDAWEAFKQHTKKYTTLFLVFILLVSFVLSFIPFKIMADNEAKRISNIRIDSFQIVPGNNFNPTSSPIPPDALTVMLGDKVGVFMRRDQKHIIANQGKPIVSLWLDDKGSLLISADIYDDNDRQILRLDGNDVRSNPFINTFNIERLNYHSFIVMAKGNEVFSVDYINPDTVQISGRFHVKGYSDPFIITPDSYIHFDGLYIEKTLPFMVDLTKDPNSYFINITDKGGIDLGGHIFGEGSAK